MDPLDKMLMKIESNKKVPFKEINFKILSAKWRSFVSVRVCYKQDKGINSATKSGFNNTSRLFLNISPITMLRTHIFHGDVMTWKHFPHYWPFEGVYSPVNPPHKWPVMWRFGGLFAIIVMKHMKNIRMADDLRRLHVHATSLQWHVMRNLRAPD